MAEWDITAEWTVEAGSEEEAVRKASEQLKSGDAIWHAHIACGPADDEAWDIADEEACEGSLREGK